MTSIGTGVFVVRTNLATFKNEILIGRRSNKCSRAPGIWALPGGMREEDETLSECARREVMEETGLVVRVHELGELQVSVLGVMDHFPREKHITAWVLAHYVSGVPVVVEPDKCDCWEWHQPQWVFENVPQVGEQRFWTNQEAWKQVLKPTGYFTEFTGV